MAKSSGRSGISMVRYIAKHEAHVREFIAQGLSSDSDRQALLTEHLEKIHWLQHERLVHLLVTLLFVAIFLTFYSYLLILSFNILVMVLLVIVGIVLAAYIWHYFQLENSTQRWYQLADEIREPADSDRKEHQS